MERRPGPDLPRLALGIAGMMALFAAALFGGAGTVRWAAGWIYLALFTAFTVALSAWLARHDPALLDERVTGFQRSEQGWDLAFIGVAYVMFFAWVALMGADAVRFGWSRVPGWARVAGAVALVASFRLFFLVFRANSFLSPAVRVQAERRQTVVDTGPYARVRHPMYASVIPFAAGTALLLGSWWGLAGAAPVMALVAWRAVREERVLAAGLPGYAEYMKRVRFRLVPGIW